MNKDRPVTGRNEDANFKKKLVPFPASAPAPAFGSATK